MPINPNDLEAALELLETRTVKTDKGIYVSVDDLRALASEFREQRQAEQEAPSYKSFAAANDAAKADRELQEAFTPRPPVVDHVKPERMLTGEAS